MQDPEAGQRALTLCAETLAAYEKVRPQYYQFSDGLCDSSQCMNKWNRRFPQAPLYRVRHVEGESKARLCSGPGGISRKGAKGASLTTCTLSLCAAERVFYTFRIISSIRRFVHLRIGRRTALRTRSSRRVLGTAQILQRAATGSLDAGI